MLEKIKKILKYAGCIVGGAFLVIKFPVVSIGFMAAYAARWGGNEYEKVILGSIASVLAVFLLMNIAELAVLATAFPVFDLFKAWYEHVTVA